MSLYVLLLKYNVQVEEQNQLYIKPSQGRVFY